MYGTHNDFAYLRLICHEDVKAEGEQKAVERDECREGVKEWKRGTDEEEVEVQPEAE